MVVNISEEFSAFIATSAGIDFSTPCYVYDFDFLESKILSTKSDLSCFELFYAVKANSALDILKSAKALRLGLDVASLSELSAARNAGVSPENIVFGGPGKTRATLETAADTGGCIVSVDSMNELYVLEKLSINIKKRFQIILRINSSHSIIEAGEHMAGGASQFGIDEEQLPDVIEYLQDTSLKVLGIHVHIASQILNPSEIIHHYSETTKLAKRVMKKLGQPLKIINYGGGIGVPYNDSEHEVNISSIGKLARKTIKSILGLKMDDTRLILELGRFLVCEAGVFVTEILDIKQSRGDNFIICQSGIAGFARPKMPWANSHRVQLIPNRQSKLAKYTICGPSCLPADILVKHCSLRTPKIGDKIIFENAGAYGFTMSLQLWCGLQPPIEVLYRDNGFQLMRRRFCPTSDASINI